MTLFIRDGYWHMDAIDKTTGKRIRKSLRTKDKEEAEKLAESILYGLESDIVGRTLGDVMTLFSSPDTNPRMKECKITGESYSADYAAVVAKQTLDMYDIIKKEYPNLLKSRMNDITSIQIRKVRELIYKLWGNSRKSQYYFRTFKTYFSEAARQGWSERNVALGQGDIKYKEKEVYIISRALVSLIIDDKEHYTDLLVWAFCVLIATTGIRRGEALAVSRETYDGRYLTIDRAVGSGGMDDIKPPKWGLTRKIPLPEITRRALGLITPDESGRYFHKNRHWAQYALKTVINTECALHPQFREEWSSLGWHAFRHGVNTELLAEGISPALVAEYLSWNHQQGIQGRYTNFRPEHLEVVALSLDCIFTEKYGKLYLSEQA